MIKKTVIFLVTISYINLFYSCVKYVPRRVIQKFNYCYDPHNDFSNSKIKLNGYYVSIKPIEVPHYDINGRKTYVSHDTIYNNLMFFQNGIIVRGFRAYNNENTDNFLLRVFQSKQNEKKTFYDGFRWGVYKISNDTIKTQTLNRTLWLNPYWYLHEIWYLINSDNTLSCIYSKNLLFNDNYSGKIHEPKFFFHETNFYLKPNTWLKQQKWFWCNENEWKNYMDSLKLINN